MPPPPPPPPPPTPPIPGEEWARLGAERPIPPRFHNPLDEEGLSVPGGGVGATPTEEEDPLTLDHGEEKVDDAGDLLALMTPGRRKFDGELGPERPNSI